MFRTPTDDGAREARSALFMIHDARTVPYLVRALEATEPEMHRAAKEALEGYTNDPEPALRDEARRQLAAHKPR
jgi:hypothetical protein